MTPTKFLLLIGCLALTLVSCSEKETLTSKDLNQIGPRSNGMNQISGIGYWSDGECTEEEDAYFALYLTGDLEGCLYVYPEYYNCTPSGVYFESGQEHFVGTYTPEDGDPVSGSFWTTYNFEAKYEDCEGLVGEIFGRCQHPIQEDSGTDGFEGVEGRIDFKDDVENGTFPYRGHLRF